MQFTVTYRSRSGTVETEVFDSASRAELFRQLQGRGISPIKVAEGAQGVKPKSGGSTAKDDVRRSVSTRYWIMVAMALAVGVCVWFCIGPAKPRFDAVQIQPAKQVPKKAAVHIAANPEAAKPIVKPKVGEVDVSTETNAVPVELYNGKKVVGRDVRTNRTGAVIEKIRLVDGRLIESVHPPKPIFSNPSDQLIAMAISAKPGQSMAPMPDMASIDKDFANSFLSPIRIEDSDSEDVKALKLAVKEARAYIAAEVKKGRTVQECLNEHCEQIERIADSHQMALMQIRKLRDDGASPEEIAQFREHVNEVFRAKGILELPAQSENRKMGDK